MRDRGVPLLRPALLVCLALVLALIVLPRQPALADDVEQRIAEFWKRVDALGPADHLGATDLGQWALNVSERDPGAGISVADFRASTAGMQSALDRASAGIPPGSPKSPDVEERIARFWQRVDTLGPADLLSASDLGQWALNVIDRDPSKRIRVDDFRASTAGMQAGLDHARSSPRPATPAPTAAGISFVFGDDVTMAERDRVGRIATLAEQDLKARYGASASPFTVFVHSNLDELVADYVAFHRIPTDLVAGVRQRWSFGFAEAGKENVFIYTGGPGWPDAISTGTVEKILFHEIFHVLQNRLVAPAYRNFIEAPDSDVPVGGPRWLIEGAAELVGYTLADDHGYASFAAARAAKLRDAQAVTAPLSTMESLPGLVAAGPGAAYTVGFLAAELLTATAGPQALARYWTEIGAGRPWQAAFETVFGRSITTFYDEFEVYRRQGFVLPAMPTYVVANCRPGYDCRVTTIAGRGIPDVGDGSAARDAVLARPQSVAVAPDGTLYIADTDNHRIRRVVSGLITTVAGTGSAETQDPGDGGRATAATVRFPKGVAAAPDGSVYIADSNHYVVRRVAPDGTIRTVLGKSFNYDIRPLVEGSRAVDSIIGYPRAVAAAADGSFYVALSTTNQVVRVDPLGIVHIVAGTGQPGFGGDLGPAVQARINDPEGIALDEARGLLYIADTGNARLRRVDLARGTISTVVAEGAASVATDPNGIVYYATGYQVRRWDPLTDRTTVFAGTGLPGFGGDGLPATSASLNFALGVAADAQGNVYVADTLNDRIRRVAPDGTISTIAGGRTPDVDGVRAVNTYVSDSQGVAIDRVGGIVFTDFPHGTLRRIGPDGVVARIAGRNGLGSGGDGGHPLEAWFDAPRAPVFDRRGNLFFVDRPSYHVVRRISPDADGLVNGSGDERVSTVVGYAGDWRSPDRGAADGGPATRALLQGLYGLAADSRGNIYIADTNDNRVRRIAAGADGEVSGALDETITTVLGNGTAATTGDGGPAVAAAVSHPVWLAIDRADNVYVAQNDGRIRLIGSQTGIVSTFASVQGGVTSIAVDDLGNVFFGNSREVGWIDAETRTVRRLLAVGQAGLVSPNYLTWDPSGSVVFADNGSFTIRRLEFVPSSSGP